MEIVIRSGKDEKVLPFEHWRQHCLKWIGGGTKWLWGAMLNPIKAIVRLCPAIGQLQLSGYTWLLVNRFIDRSMSCPGTIGGTVPISTSDNSATGWPLYITSNNKLRRHSRVVFSRQPSLHLRSMVPQNKCFFLLTCLRSLFIHCAAAELMAIFSDIMNLKDVGSPALWYFHNK